MVFQPSICNEFIFCFSVFIIYMLFSENSFIFFFTQEPHVSSLNVYSREPAMKSPSESLPEQSLTPHHTKDSADSVTPSHQNGVLNQTSRKSSNASDKLLIQELQDQYNLLLVHCSVLCFLLLVHFRLYLYIQTCSVCCSF